MRFLNLFTGGVMMELVPLRVHECPGTRTTFSCSYRSNERLQIEFEALSTLNTAQHNRMFSKREILADLVSRYSWGATRQWTLLVQPHHKLVNCNLRNAKGFLVGQLTAVIETGFV